jgi:Bifunctional DNA primase/polymerase, N-terminal
VAQVSGEHPTHTRRGSSTGITVGWRELCNAAVRATGWGWPVVPGTYLGADRRWHGRQDTPGLCPISDTWRDTSITDPEYAHEIWSQHPYGVLLVCGLGVDVLELPSSMLGVLSALQSATPVIPVAITGSPPQFLVFTATDPGTVLPDLQEVHLHGAGSWIALPPTATELVLMQRWWTTPAEGELPLLPTQVVLDALRSAGLGVG